MSSANLSTQALSNVKVAVMELKEQPFAPTLAEQLGDAAHVLLHIAAIAERFALHDEPWAYLRRHLQTRRVPRTDALPHWTRLVSHTGISSHGGASDTVWLRRCE